MTWCKRVVVLVVLMLALTPAPAHAWFEWLDYLSGPGPFYGFKMDLRLWCSGAPAKWNGIRRTLDEAILSTVENKPDPAERKRVTGQWQAIYTALRESNNVFPLTDPERFSREIDEIAAHVAALRNAATLEPREVFRVGEDLHRVLDTYERAATSIASTGIFISLCQNDRIRSVAVEVGFSTLQAGSNPDYANDHTIRLNMITAAVSYRLPLPPDRDIIDIGTSAGMYIFSSAGFDTFRGLTIEPLFIDLHAPTKVVAAGGLKQLAGLFTLRLSGVMFPQGFENSQFNAAPSKGERITGSEVNLSATVFFNLTPLLWRRPATAIPRYGPVRP